MADPIAHDGGVLGVKFASLVAGFAGGVVSLSFLKQLTPLQAVLAVFTGTVTAGYGTPVILHYMGGVPSELQNGVAFFVGLSAMNIIPGVMRLSERFKSNPEAFIGHQRGDGEK